MLTNNTGNKAVFLCSLPLSIFSESETPLKKSAGMRLAV